MSEESKKKTKIKRICLLITSIVLLAILSIGGFFYFQLSAPLSGVKNTVYVYVDDKKDYDNLLLQLQSTANITNIGLFDRMAAAINYPEKMKTGRYAVKPGMSCKTLLQHLRNGEQEPCKLTFNNMRTKEDFSDRTGSQFMFGKNELLTHLSDSVVCDSLGFDQETILCMFVPNTYEIYWNIPVDRFLKRMKKEYDTFWTEDRLDKAREIPLTPIQVSILASIVEEETAARSEYPIVAGLYINRLRQNMLLQADPTVKFAVGDFSLKRVLYVHLEEKSPYNTYQNQGLPPGPIRIPSVGVIDGVLHYAQHHYLYMCAKEDFSGKHNFAATMAEHNQNAAKYRAALDRNNIK